MSILAPTSNNENEPKKTEKSSIKQTLITSKTTKIPPVQVQKFKVQTGKPANRNRLGR